MYSGRNGRDGTRLTSKTAHGTDCYRCSMTISSESVVHRHRVEET